MKSFTQEQLREMPGPKLRDLIEKLNQIHMLDIDEFIADGRGNETFSEWYRKSDPLSLRARQNLDNWGAADAELKRRLEYHGKHTPIKNRL